MASKNLWRRSAFFGASTLLLWGLFSPGQAETRAYWRFEDGTPGEYTAIGKGVSADTTGQNPLSVAARETRPFSNGDVPLATIPQTGTPNRVAVQLYYSGDFYSSDDPVNKIDFGAKG